MMGADAVAMGRNFLIAANTKGAKGIENFVEATTEEIKMLSATQRVHNVVDLKGRTNNLYSVSEDAAKMFGITNEVKKLI